MAAGAWGRGYAAYEGSMWLCGSVCVGLALRGPTNFLYCVKLGY